MEDPAKSPKSYAIFSALESRLNNGRGFWSNNSGWDKQDKATLFSKEESESVGLLPLRAGCDAEWVPVQG